MEIKSNKKQTKSFYIPLLLALLVIAAVVAVTTSFREAAEDARRASVDTSDGVPVVATPSPEDTDLHGKTPSFGEARKDAEENGEKGDETAPVMEETPSPETEAAAPAEPAIPTFVPPVSGVVSKYFSADVPVFSETMNDYRVHAGVDVTGEAGEAVLADADGVIGAVWDDPLMGRCMTIVHDAGFVSTYKGLYETLPEGIAQGAAVSAGQPVAAIGETALIEVAEEPHVHFELTRDGVAVDPCLYVTFSETESFGE